jgi:signal transduction histidine kinase
MSLEDSIKTNDILIVDDVPDNIRFLSNFLTGKGYVVRKATSGRSAIKAIESLVPDLVLLDIMMDGMDGYEVCRWIKDGSYAQAVPVIFLSAGDSINEKVKAFQIGASDYITKPFYLEEVLARIETQLTISRLQRQLENQNVQLQSVLENLRKNQEHLIQTEKMATLKKIVAGVSHEVNNPLSFILCNIDPARHYLADFADLVSRYQRSYDIKTYSNDGSQPVSDLSEARRDVDFSFIIKDFNRLLTSIEKGADRIYRVTQSLKNFTHLDETGLKELDINQNLEHTLNLLQDRLANQGHSIHVQRDYGEVPFINGHPDQICQVFFNILVNAIEAIVDKFGQGKTQDLLPMITITTATLEDHSVIIRIHDNGIGIPEMNQSRIMQPFFTTRPAGQGLGLGLVTCKRIIEEVHGGRLSFVSIDKLETEFTIILPI